MNHNEAFFILGIPATKDTASIKKAYQKLVTRYHPEENPQEFILLHEAYKTALAYAKEKMNADSSSSEFHWRPDTSTPPQEETGYDSLFHNLEETDSADLSQQKKRFFRKLLWLKLHWLPIPLRSWAGFFNSEAFLLCRKEPECMEKLYELLVTKIHTYRVFRFLISRLWETENWLRSEDLEVSATQTRKCIEELHRQYHHYLCLDPNARISRWVQSAKWYYQALPFFFKMLISLFLIPLLSLGSNDAFLIMLFGFYIVEIYISVCKMARKLGFFRPIVWKYSWAQRFNISGNSGMLLVVGIYTILFHLFLCAGIWENLYG